MAIKKPQNIKINQLYLILLSTVVTGCGSGACNTSSISSNLGTVSSLVFNQPYEFTSFESYAGNGYIIVTNADESRAVNNIVYNLSSTIGGGALVSIDSTSAKNCTTLMAKESCVLKLNLEAGAYGGSFVIGATNSDNIMANSKEDIYSIHGIKSKVPVGVEQVITTSDLGVAGIKLFYYPSVRNGTPSIIVVGSVISNNVGNFNSAMLLDINNQPLSGQKVISNNLGAGNANLKQGDSFSIMLPVPATNSPLQFKLQISEVAQDGTEILREISSNLNTVTALSNQAIVYNYPASIGLTINNTAQQVAVANIGDKEATNYNVSSSNTSVATVTMQSPTLVSIQNKSILSTSIPIDGIISYTVSLTNPSQPPYASFSINQNYFNGDITESIATPAVSANNTWPSPKPISCSWQEVGNASSFFDFLYKTPRNVASPILLSPDGSKLYVGGSINYTGGTHLGVAVIDTVDGTTWTSVADSEETFTSDVLNQLSSLAITADGEKLYIGGQSFLGEDLYPAVYLSSNGNGWTRLSNMSTALNNVKNYTINGIVLEQNNLYAAGSYNGSSFVAKSINDGEWSSVADSQNVFNGIALYAITYGGGSLYVGGESSLSQSTAIYQLPTAGSWTNFSPESSTSGPIFSLATSDTMLYAGGIYKDYSNSMVLSTSLAGIANWTDISANLGADWVNSLFISHNTLYAGGIFESYIKSTPVNSSINWTAVWDAGDTLDGSISNIVVSSDGTVYADGEFSQKVVKLKCQ